MSRMSRRACTVIVALIGSACVAFSWNSVGPYTHEKITDDAINALSATDYPDVHRFAEKLRDGSETEAHAPPGVDGTSPTDPHRWDPDREAWWNGGGGTDKKGALPLYDEYEFEDAFEAIGFFLHLAQDLYVPAHIYRCIHGSIIDGIWTDDLEDYVDDSSDYGYIYNSGNTAWQFTDSQNRTWQYWLDDTMDDDDENDVADGVAGGDPDHDGIEEDKLDEWGLGDNKFGTYGYGDDDPLPGNHQGLDYFEQYPNVDVAHKQLKLAFDDTFAEIKAKSKALPPLVPDDATHGEPSISEKIFGPNSDPVDIEFIAMENRKKTIYVSVLAGSTAIEDTSSKTWDGGSGADYDLPSEDDTDQLPWKGTLTLSWDGTLSSGDLDDGQHTIALKVKDEDGNESEERTRTVKYDKTKPSGSITVTVSP